MKRRFNLNGQKSYPKRDVAIVRYFLPSAQIIKPLSISIDTISSSLAKREPIRAYEVFVGNVTKGIVIKDKSSRIILNGAKLLSQRTVSFASILRARRILGYNNSYKREAKLYSGIDDELRAYLPHFYGHKASIGETTIAYSAFPDSLPVGEGEIKRCLKTIAIFHAHYYGKTEVVSDLGLNSYSAADYRKAKKMLFGFAHRNARRELKVYGAELVRKLGDFVEKIDEEYEVVQDHRTLTHNDFSKRNVCVTKTGCIFYDWELACYQNPEHDLVDFLCSAIDENTSAQKIREYVSIYYDEFEKLAKVSIDGERRKKYLRFNLYEFAVNRLAILQIYEARHARSFVEESMRNLRRITEAVL